MRRAKIDRSAELAEARKAIEESRRRLSEAQDKSAEVTDLAARARKLRERNHFGEMIEASMERRRRA